MRLTVAILCMVTMSLFAQSPGDSLDGCGCEKGVQAYKEGRYQEAVDVFQQAVDRNPNNVNTRLYLGSALMAQYIPGADSPENVEFARRAETEFDVVTRLDRNNVTALSSLASLSYQEAQGIQDIEAKLRKFDESASWYEKVVVVDPRNKEAYYSIGVIDWLKWYSADLKARAQLGMRPDDPGPLRDPALRRELREKYGPLIEDGISKLQKALEIDPAYDDAMAYMNLMIRYRADLVDTPEQYLKEIEVAQQWVIKALDIKSKKSRAVSGTPTPRAPTGGGGGGGERTLRVGGSVQQDNLIHRVDPVYPPLARQARIQGTVHFSAIIGRDGSVLNLQLVSGHPLLVESARQAVMQWLYKPTLFNGQLVDVLTQINVAFSLSGAEKQ